MDCYRDSPSKYDQEFLEYAFSENEKELEFGPFDPIKPKRYELSYKCEFEWDPVDMRSMCWKCGRVINRPIYNGGGDFDAWNSGRQYGKVGRFSQPQCPIKTIRGHQCTYPCRSGKDLCLKHLNLAKKNGAATVTDDTSSDWERRLNFPQGAWERFT